MRQVKDINNIFNFSSNQLTDKEVNYIVDKLCDPDSYKLVYHKSHHEDPMPSMDVLREIVDLLKSIIFPGYFINSELNPSTMKYYIGSTLETVFRLLVEQVRRGFCFSCETHQAECVICETNSRAITKKFIAELPEIRRLLSLDAVAAFEGDPAAKEVGETIFCYPSIIALTHHRIAHELYSLNVPLIPRMISELAHSDTGIDIHPGATIGEYFFIDHGTGTVIGETTIIGKRVRIYQGVTLGAKSFPLDESGNPIKGIPRHPVVEDEVIVYSGATILGRVTIGHNSEIGGNVWLTEDVSPGSRIVQSKAEEIFYRDGSGI